MHVSRLWLAALAAGLVTQACGNSTPISVSVEDGGPSVGSDASSWGTEGAECFPNGTCMPGLTCAANRCLPMVEADASTPGTDASEPLPDAGQPDGSEPADGSVSPDASGMPDAAVPVDAGGEPEADAGFLPDADTAWPPDASASDAASPPPDAGVQTPDASVQPPDAGVSYVKLELRPVTKLTLGITGSIQLEVVATDPQSNVQILAPNEVKWTSSAPAIVRVEPDGWLHAVGLGSATLTVAAGGATAQATITSAPIDERVWGGSNLRAAAPQSTLDTRTWGQANARAAAPQSTLDTRTWGQSSLTVDVQ
jgi:hypothetical protein